MVKRIALFTLLMLLPITVWAECVRSAPRVTLTPDALTVDASAIIPLTVHIENLDSAECEPRNFRVNAVGQAGGGEGDYEPNPTIRYAYPEVATLAPGESGYVALTVTISANVSPPAYWFITAVVGLTRATASFTLAGETVPIAAEAHHYLCEACELLHCYEEPYEH